MSNIEKLLKKMKSIVEDDNDEKVIVRTTPLTPKWVKMWAELKEAKQVAIDANRKWSSLKDLFWGTVSVELNDFRNMSLNNEDPNNLFIEILEDQPHA